MYKRQLADGAVSHILGVTQEVDVFVQSKLVEIVERCILLELFEVVPHCCKMCIRDRLCASLDAMLQGLICMLDFVAITILFLLFTDVYKRQPQYSQVRFR